MDIQIKILGINLPVMLMNIKILTDKMLEDMEQEDLEKQLMEVKAPSAAVAEEPLEDLPAVPDSELEETRQLQELAAWD